MLDTVQEQRTALDSIVEPRFIYHNPHIKSPFTTGDYVRWNEPGYFLDFFTIFGYSFFWQVY